MKKFIVVLGVVLTFAIAAAPAWSAGYYISLPRAKHIAREVAKQECEEEGNCTSYGWSCRLNGNWANCLETLYYPGVTGEIVCENALHLTIGPGGYIRQGYGEVSCH